MPLPMLRSIFTLLFVVLFHAAFAQISPVQGDDLIKALGQRETSPTSQKLQDFAGSNGNARGIKIAFIDKKLARIELYNDNNPWGTDINQFKGSLPKGLSFIMDIATAKQHLGNGFEESGDIYESYYAFKNYHLLGKDSAQVNLEFVQGRLINVALIYLEGETGIKGKDGEETVYPLEGDDYLVMIKKNTYNKELGKLFNMMGYASYKGRHELVYANEGVEIVFNSDNQVEWIILYGGGQSSEHGGQPMQACKFPLPFGLKFGMGATAINAAIGPPTGRDGGALVYDEGYSRVYLDMGSGGLSKVRVGINPDFKIEKAPSKKPVRNY